ncbi:hypothetical protein [Roseomonas indoligenes]|uniref:Lipoprotein n=1 Tax=Roseomonas indoligenes TaxID=2820811 RepID=A0A940MUR7_9PROT|nr:hypothetical protein [Pararoseomonas indoligenes]MBP0491310.1 hypothetical protein [Pararoseomonas indoligenes]
MRRLALPFLVLVPLSGCGLATDLTSAAAGVAAGTATANPALGFGIAVGTRAAVQAGLNWAVRVRARGEQDAVAEAIGRLAPGETLAWRSEHTIPFGDEEGEARLVREMVTPLATCREALFSIAEGEGAERTQEWFLTTACRQKGGDGERWKWAAAEPATARWGSLQ